MKSEPATKLPETHEGPEAAARFVGTMRALLAVPHSEIQRKIEEHRRQAAENPNRRGPKPKRKAKR